MRKYLQVRYDARLNIFDWDYQMRLSQRDVSMKKNSITPKKKKIPETKRIYKDLLLALVAQSCAHPIGDQEVTDLITGGNILCWRLIMIYFLRLP